MALINVNEVFDPLFTTGVQLVCQEPVYGEYGERVGLNFSETAYVNAVVSGDSRTLATLPEELRRSGTITVLVRMDDIPDGFYPSAYSYIEVNRQQYDVVSVVNGSFIGQGYMRFVCEPRETEKEG